jgi:NAD(P)-dependent dehydrogenase (short-subunit alcohol dehydrogenase family)
MSDHARTWLITGCSSGLGRALAQELIAQGQRVFPLLPVRMSNVPEAALKSSTAAAASSPKPQLVSRSAVTSSRKSGRQALTRTRASSSSAGERNRPRGTP